MDNLEFRSLSNVTVVDSTDSMVIEGVVNNVGEFSKVLGGKFRERIEPGVFTRAIDRADDVFFLHQHNHRDLPLASVKSGTLELREDVGQLKMRATLPETTLAKDIYKLVEAGVLREFSFGFNNPISKWSTGNDGVKERTLKDFNISEISIVKTGAYNDTAAFARALEEAEKVITEEAAADKKEEVVEQPFDIKMAAADVATMESKLNAEMLELESKQADVEAAKSELEKAKLKLDQEKAKIKPAESESREYECRLALLKKRFN